MKRTFLLLPVLASLGACAATETAISGACKNDEGVTVLLAGLVPVAGSGLSAAVETTCDRMNATPVPIPTVPAGNTPPLTVTVTPTVPAKT